jgi:hypothetical protein
MKKPSTKGTPAYENKDVRVVKDFYQLRDDFQIHSEATINLGSPTVAVNARLESLKEKFFSNECVLIECRVEGHYHPDLLDLSACELTDEAKALIQSKSYKAFRDKYGDYFVQGYERHFKFSGIVAYRCALDCNDQERR